MWQYYLLSRMCLSINHVSLGFFLTSIICYMSQIIVDLFGNKVWFELIKNYKKTACFSFRIGNNSKLYISSSIWRRYTSELSPLQDLVGVSKQ
jgi:hypothetical protein